MEDKNKKVCIVLCINKNIKSFEAIEEITYGIEEEGIPFTIIFKEKDDVKELCEIAIKESQLGVGIGVDSQYLASLYQEKLPENYLLFTRNLLDSLKASRDLGVNAARLVKGAPFRS
ncbi:glycerol dehydratase reactivase beta/small subunit family protein [Irregularibacter muris]|jgi:hypothetical protein|uniref:Glycerol dehydratase reactivase beta/small subunit family protein n=1 Tax=Irregularibacter muris TaxID=1796619 RepID=A0AAE3KZA2_9FIRM|nr:glycerol dehydratase reactivase beta/small subunit family protein [Irregularibacter muris]MCR1898396.1 glycerol dehydratase reactivase beta/small subunit family protein [Irregularibacter muris]